MIKFTYELNAKKDERTFITLSWKDVNKGEASDFVHELEKVKLFVLEKDWELGKGGLQVTDESEEEE